MSCIVRIFFDAIGVPGTPSSGNDLLGRAREIVVPNGNYIGEWANDSSTVGACPSVQQTKYWARDPTTGDIVGETVLTSCHNIVYTGWENTCPPVESVPHDCINGACIPAAEYNTPGLYQSLSECEQVCGSQGCSGKCLGNAEWATIQELANKLKNQNCK